jgi:hypothetical protein
MPKSLRNAASTRIIRHPAAKPSSQIAIKGAKAAQSGRLAARMSESLRTAMGRFIMQKFARRPPAYARGLAAVCLLATVLQMTWMFPMSADGEEPRPKSVGSAHTAGLYVVVSLRDGRTRALDIQASFSSPHSGSGPAAASVIALPCPDRRYSFIAERSALAFGPPHMYSAVVHIGAARLPQGVPCGRPIPASFGVASFRMRITPLATPSDTDFIISGERLPNGNLNAAIGHVTNSLCAGRYNLAATFVRGTPSLSVSFAYPFRLTEVKGASECGSSAAL